MANAKRDDNRVRTWIATSNADGTTPVLIKVDATSRQLLFQDGAGGSDLSDEPTKRDDNRTPCLMGVSSADGTTPVPIYADPATGELLIKST